MGKLEEVEKQLYGKEKEAADSIERRTKWRMPFSPSRNRAPHIWAPEHIPLSDQETPWVRHPWRYFFGGIFVVLTLLAGIFVFFYLRAQGQEARIEIQSSNTTQSGGIMTFSFVYKNISHTTLRDGEIVITLPEDSLVRDQGNESEAPPRISKPVESLKPGDQGVIEISARLFGQEREDQKIQAIYYYRPENLRARFSARAEKSVRIVKVPLALSWEVPETLSRGQDVSINVRYTLDGALSFQDMALRMEYPDGFTFTSSEPKPAISDNMWHIGTLEPGKEGIITIRGVIVGEEGEVKAFRSSLGTFNASTKQLRVFSQSSKEITIAITPLSVQGFLGNLREGVVIPGAILNFAIRYRNNTNTVLKNITVKALLTGVIVDPLTFHPANDGIIDSQTGAAVWGPGNVAQLRELQPNESGELAVSVNIKNPPPVTTQKDKNLTVVMRSSISVASIPDELRGTKLTAEDTIEFKLASKIVFGGKSLHGLSPIPNSGPLPPQVGQKTSYAILWEIKNFTNDIANAEVTTRLPPNVTWENVTKTDGAPVTYDNASGEVRWRIGKIPAGTGVLSPTLTAAFQVAIIPAETDRGKAIRLINPSRLTGTDSFANIPVNQEIDVLTTELPFDTSATSGHETVR